MFKSRHKCLVILLHHEYHIRELWYGSYLGGYCLWVAGKACLCFCLAICWVTFEGWFRSFLHSWPFALLKLSHSMILPLLVAIFISEMEVSSHPHPNTECLPLQLIQPASSHSHFYALVLGTPKCILSLVVSHQFKPFFQSRGFGSRFTLCMLP